MNRPTRTTTPVPPTVESVHHVAVASCWCEWLKTYATERDAIEGAALHHLLHRLSSRRWHPYRGEVI